MDCPPSQPPFLQLSLILYHQGWIKPGKTNLITSVQHLYWFSLPVICHIKNKCTFTTIFSPYLHLLFCTIITYHLCLDWGSIGTEGNQPSTLHLMSLWFDVLKQHTVLGLLSWFIFPYKHWQLPVFHCYVILLFFIDCCLHHNVSFTKGVAFSVLLTSVSTEPGVRAENVAVTKQISGIA